MRNTIATIVGIICLLFVVSSVSAAEIDKKMVNEGVKMMEKGEQMCNEGEKMMKEGEKMMMEGVKMMSKGKTMIEESGIPITHGP
jgi:hypothetical protein